MSRLIRWFASNGVVANLMMFVIVAAGVLSVPALKQEVFPEFSIEVVRVSVPYRGAAPEEVEEGVVIRVEEAIQGLDGIKKITSVASEGVGSVFVQIDTDYDPREFLDDVKARVDAIDTFPAETERPIIEQLQLRKQVINISVSGPADERTLRRLGEQVRDEVVNLKGISQVELKSARPYEISIEVAERSLRRWGLTFDEVASRVRRTAVELPGGSLKTSSGEILLRTDGQAYIGEEFERLTLLTRPDGTRIHLGDVASVVDGFEENEKWTRLDGQPAVLVQVFRVGDESAVEISDAVHGYVRRKQTGVPEGIQLTTWQDDAELLQARIDQMLKNAAQGLLLVFIVLALFLRLRLAFWVALGIPVSFLGALAVLPVAGISINVISLFSFILVLGIVVDDAIVVGESIFSRQQHEADGLTAAIDGTQHVAIPVIFGVMTTVVAFAPFLGVDGTGGRIVENIPYVVIPCLIFSLIESQLILPFHLSHLPSPGKATPIWIRPWEWLTGAVSSALAWFIDRVYRPLLECCLTWRYLTVSLAVTTLFLTVGLVGGGWVKFIFMTQDESNKVLIALTMPQGTPANVTARAISSLETDVLNLKQRVSGESQRPLMRHVLTSLGELPPGGGPDGSLQAVSAPNVASIEIELVPSEDRDVANDEVVRMVRDWLSVVPGAEKLTVNGGDREGPPIAIELTGPNMADLEAAAEATKEELRSYRGVSDISDNYVGGKSEVKLAVRSNALALGLSLSDLGRQVRQGFFGEEAQRIQRGRDDIRVMVRYPREHRESLGSLENMRIRTPAGGEVPFGTVARTEMGWGYANIIRVNRQRSITVSADVDNINANANEVLSGIEAEFLPTLTAEYRSIRYAFEGDYSRQQEFLEQIYVGFGAALFVMYALMAIPFKSYLQPLIVMSAVPFGVVGAIWGHVVMGLPMTFISMCGVVAVAGVVVNDSLVMVSFINYGRGAGKAISDVVRDAGVRRFRPILLTSLTTAAGITPLMLENSVQARFLIPMAVSIAFGVVFATAISLLLVPVGYLILDDFGRLQRWLYPPHSTDPSPAQSGD